MQISSSSANKIQRRLMVGVKLRKIPRLFAQPISAARREYIYIYFFFYRPSRLLIQSEYSVNRLCVSSYYFLSSLHKFKSLKSSAAVFTDFSLQRDGALAFSENDTFNVVRIVCSDSSKICELRS